MEYTLQYIILMFVPFCNILLFKVMNKFYLLIFNINVM